MVMMPTPANAGDQPTWLGAAWGRVDFAGVVVLGDVALATVQRVRHRVGRDHRCFEIIILSGRGWGGFIWQIILGLLYIGIIIINQPVAGVLSSRGCWACSSSRPASSASSSASATGPSRAGCCWSPASSAIAGVIILSGWPMTGLWVIGFCSASTSSSTASAGWRSADRHPGRHNPGHQSRALRLLHEQAGAPTFV